MEPLAGLSLPAVGLWIMASLMSYAAGRGMPVEPRFDSGAPSNSFRVDGAACRIIPPCGRALDHGFAHVLCR